MKKCKTCKQEKSEIDFNKWYKKTGSSGYRSSCKLCQSLINKSYRKVHQDRLKMKRRERSGAQPKRYCTDPDKKRKNEYVYKSQRKSPEKVIARSILNSHVHSGKILKPERCEVCGNKGKLEAHHEDYSRPLDVKWVCKSCHMYFHWNKYKAM